MSYIYEPDIEEEEGGYSIPKILVAVLLLVLIGAGVYIYFQQQKLTTSITYLLDTKKQVEQDLNQMIEKYNLAIDDNGDLEGELKLERDHLIKYRDSIKKVKDGGVKEIADFKKTISKLKEKSAIQFNQKNTSESTSTDLVETEEIVDSLVTEAVSEKNNKTEVEIDSLKKEEEKEEEKEEKEEKVITSTTFNRVEIPPIYPGCEGGSALEKKACFAKKVKKHLSRKYDTSIIDNLSLAPGKRRVWVHFNIDKYGNVVNVSARGPHKDLEDEAVRVIKKLPNMVAATQNSNSVQISYSVPITIRVE